MLAKLKPAWMNRGWGYGGYGFRDADGKTGEE